MLLFQYLGVLYSWGVIQAELSRTRLASSLQLSLIGATAAFCLAFGCLPVCDTYPFRADRIVLIHTGDLGLEKSRSQMDSSVRDHRLRTLPGFRRIQPK